MKLSVALVEMVHPASLVITTEGAGVLLPLGQRLVPEGCCCVWDQVSDEAWNKH